MFLYKTQSSAKRQTDDLILSGRSLMNIKTRTGPKTVPCGTPDKTGTGSEAWPSIHHFLIALRERCVPLPEWTGMVLITGMDYRNGHLYVSLSTFSLVFKDKLS